MLMTSRRNVTESSGEGSLPVAARYRAMLRSAAVGLFVILGAASAQAGGGNQCFYEGSIDYFWSAEGQNPQDNNCQGNSGWRCYRGEVTGIWAEVAPGCDPAVATCTTEVHASLLARGVGDMVAEDGLGGTPTPAALPRRAGTSCVFNYLQGPHRPRRLPAVQRRSRRPALARCRKDPLVVEESPSFASRRRARRESVW
jgi:hypothetical protein